MEKLMVLKKIPKIKPTKPNNKMKASEKKILTAFLDKTLNLSAETVVSLFEKNGDDEDLKDDALKTLEKADADRVQTLKGDSKTIFDNGYKKAQGEVLGKLEKEISDKYDIKSDKKGIELFDEIIELKTTPSDLTDDKIKVHPLYRNLEKESAKKIKEAEDAAQSKIDAKEKEITRNSTLSKIKALADAKLKELKPIFNTIDPTKVQNQIDKLLLSELNGYDYEIQGEDIIVMKDGKRLEDPHGKAISFDDLVKKTAATNWEFEEGTGRQGSGADNDDPAKKAAAAAKQTKYTGVVPKTDEEYSKAFSAITDKKERVLLTEAYDASKQAK